MNDELAALRVRCEASRKNWTKPDGIMKNQAFLRDMSDQMSIMCDKNMPTVVLQKPVIYLYSNSWPDGDILARY